MRRIGSWIVSAALVAAAAPGVAQQSPTLVTAGGQVRAKLAAAAHGAAPMLSNGDAALVRAVFDADAIRAMPLDLGTIAAACGAVGTTIVAYTEYAGRVGGTLPGGPDAVLREVQDEATRGIAAGNVCVQRLFRAAVPMVQSVAAERRVGIRAGLKQMRDGAVQTITGSIGLIADAGFRDDNRRKMLAALLEDPAAVAASFPAGERASLRAAVLAVNATGEIKAGLDKLAAALAQPACNALCELAEEQ